MTLQSLIHLTAFAALLAPILATGVASAAEPPVDGAAAPPVTAAPPPPVAAPPPPRDNARFRGGVALEGGALVVPGVVTLGIAGVQGQLGAQINNLVGVYTLPNFDILFGKVGGVNLAAAVLVDFTFNDTFSVGVGPDVGVFAGFGASRTGGDTISAAAGALYGARLHFAWYPVVDREETRSRRRALAIGVDLRILGGGAGFASTNAMTGMASVGSFVLGPQLTIGYQAF